MPTKLSARNTGCAILIAALFVFGGSCQKPTTTRTVAVSATPSPVVFGSTPLPKSASPQLIKLVEGAIEQSKITTGYDPAYVKLVYPNGDVAGETGVCSDVVVRAFRKAGIDLQKEVHEDMQAGWSAYPKKWGARGTDTNIDHRRVLNLTTFFERKGKTVANTTDRADYLPGDIVAWQLSEGVEHIGLVTNLTSDPDKHYLIVHNIGAGARIEDVLLAWPIIGHYRYFK